MSIKRRFGLKSNPLLVLVACFSFYDKTWIRVKKALHQHCDIYELREIESATIEFNW